MKVADRSGALFAIIVGDDELEKNEVTFETYEEMAPKNVYQEVTW